MEQELLNQVCGDLVSTCESYISNIVLKEDGAGQLQEDLLVSLGIIILNYPLPKLFKGAGVLGAGVPPNPCQELG